MTLTLTATGNAPCPNASSNKTLTINLAPQTTGVIICQNGSGSLTSSTTCPTTNGTSGPNFAGAGATGGGAGVAWTTANNVTANDDNYATVTGTGTAFSERLNTSNFGFAIPSGATINGIQVTLGRFRPLSVGSGNIRDNSLRLIKAGVVTGNDNANTGLDWPTTETQANYGSTSDLWGTSWSPSEINDPNFGVSLIVTHTQATSSRTANVDYFQVTVTYTVNGVLNWLLQHQAVHHYPVTGSPFNPVGVAGSGLPDASTPGIYKF